MRALNRTHPFPPSVPLAGVVDHDLERIARLASDDKNYKNAAHKLHNYLHASGKTFPVKISTASITIRRMKRGGGEFTTNYPIIHLSSWLHAVLERGGEFVLGGWTTSQKPQYMSMLGRFWKRYEDVHGSHPILQETERKKMQTIPFAIHGDEGRGLCREPVLVESYQPLIPWSGENCLNMRGHSS